MRWQHWFLGFIATAALVAPHPAAAQGVAVSILPASQTVAPGAEFDLELYVMQTGSTFNAFEAGIGFDPAALTFVPLSPISLQQGSYMTGACGNTFHLFSAGPDSLAITCSLMCLGVSLPGPGQIYKLRFRASETPQVTYVRFDSIQFYDAGSYVNPAYPSDAVISIGVELEAGPPPAGPAGLRLRATPNPCTGPVSLRVDADAAGEQILEILDPRGRLVRRLESGSFGPGARTASWDGQDARGAPVPAGVYLARVRLGSAAAGTRIIRLE